MPDSLLILNRAVITDTALKLGLPGMYPFRVFADGTGLIAYGLNLFDMHRDTAVYVDRILKGEKPGNLPVQAPTNFELVINLKVAKQLGIEMPPALLARADAIIEMTGSTRSPRRRGRAGPAKFEASALAVFRLTMKSNLVGCSTGMSAGFAPRRILSTYSAARRNSSGKFGPIGHQASAFDIFPKAEHRRQPRASARSLMCTRLAFESGFGGT